MKTDLIDYIYDSGMETAIETTKKRLMMRLSKGDFYSLISEYAKEDTDYVCNEIIKIIFEGIGSYK